MGGPESAGYRNFVDLTIKAFLSARLYAKQIVHTTSQMLAAEFPSFKGEPTMDRLLERFRLDLNEKDAAKYMISVIDNAYENRMSIVYDYFQLKTNGTGISSFFRRSEFLADLIRSRRYPLRSLIFSYILAVCSVFCCVFLGSSVQTISISVQSEARQQQHVRKCPSAGFVSVFFSRRFHGSNSALHIIARDHGHQRLGSGSDQDERGGKLRNGHKP